MGNYACAKLMTLKQQLLPLSLILYPPGSSKVAAVDELIVERLVVRVKIQPYRQITLAKRLSNKLEKRYYGPYKAKECVGKVAYRLALSASMPQERVKILLQSLPESYDQLIISLTSNVLSDYLVFDDVATAILEEENRRNNREDRQTSSRQVKALVVNERGSMETFAPEGVQNHGKSKTGKKKNFKCFKCDNPGHFRKDCRGLNTSNPHGNVASTSEDGNALCCEAAAANKGRKKFTDVWLFDTRATFHMTARREWFHQYKPISGGGSVYSCNDHELKIIGIGSIMVKMHDGTVRTIRDVRHVEGLKKNLLSLGQLDDLGCKLKGEIMEEAEASVTSHSPSHRVAITWHQKLGHMSEQGMKILVERKLLPGLTKVSLPFCEHRVISKQHRLKFKTSNSRSVYVLELVHSDVCSSI
ncbi:gag-pol polyprotein [Tanacetum coccineum]